MFKPARRIDGRAAEIDSEMDVRGVGDAGHADAADLLPFFDFLPFRA